MNKKGKILTSIVVGLLGATMLTSCSLSAEQNASVDNLLSKGNSLIEILDQKLEELSFTPEKAIEMYEDSKFNLQYRVNGCDIYELSLESKNEITMDSTILTYISDYSTPIKKEYHHGGIFVGDDTISTAVQKFNSKTESGYIYNYDGEMQIETLSETSISNCYNSMIAMDILLYEENIVSFTKENDVYIIKSKSTYLNEISENDYLKSTQYMTYKIKDNKIIEVVSTYISESADGLSDLKDEFGNNYLIGGKLESYYTLTFKYKYGNDVNLKPLNDKIDEIDARIESGELTFEED